LNLYSSKNSITISLISGTLITGISVYIVLSYLLIPARISFPISVAFSLLSLGLIKYYSITYHFSTNTRFGNNDSNAESIDISKDSYPLKTGRLSNIVFVSIFISSLLICIFLSKPEVDNIYTSWYNVGVVGLITLAAGIILSFFIPGYALVLLLTKKYTVSPLLRILLAYLFSMLITGLTTYLSEIFFNNGTYENRTFLIGVYSVLLVSFIFYHRIHRAILGLNNHTYQSLSRTANNFLKKSKNHFPEIIVFGSLFMILIIATNYLYGGITIGDQWYHQNRILLFLSGQFREYVATNGDEIYPPLQSALLAGLTTLSGIPLVNTYASIAFLNITAVFGFYYFCSIWFPRDRKRAALLASSLFVIGSGFGWIYMISLTETNPISSPISSMANFVDDKIKVTDIRLSANFMIAAFPDFSTGLIYISLPAGFVLLGLVRTNIENKLHYTAILATITVLGVLSHDEFYIFIIISSTLPLIYNLQKKHSLYVAFLVAIAFTYLIDGLLPVRYFTFQSIFGLPLLLLCTIFTLVMFAMYVLRQKLKTRPGFYPSYSFEATRKISLHIRSFNLIPKGVLVAVIVYLYLLCFIVWVQLPTNYIDVHTQKYNTPWYLYPMRLGVIGLIGLASILSYVFKRYEKEVFVFGILIIIALLAGPYYNEQRFNKYVMAGMIGFASLLVFKLLLFMTRKRPVFNGIIVSVVVISASLSTLMYIGYNALMVQTQDYTFALDRRNFPTEKELKMFDMIRSDIKVGANPYNVATFQNEYNLREGGIISKLHAFAGLPYPRITQTDYLLNASTLELFYHLLEKSNTKYILIPTNSINQQTLEDPVKFAFQNFRQIYRDDNYIVFGSPSLHGPSAFSQSEVGIIHNDSNSFSLAVQDKKPLHITNQTFDLEKSDKKFIYVHNESKVENAILFGYKKNGGKTLWSKDLEGGKINYVDFSFRILGENKTGKDSVGLKWTDGKDYYFVLLSSKGLELRRQIPNQDDNILLAQNSEVKKNDGTWYKVKIVNLENSIRVYVDDLLKINIHRDSLEKIPREISKIGIFSENNAVEIMPIQVAKINYSEQFYEKSNNYHNYYPLSSLALSGSKYNTFDEDDYSSLSMKTLILPFDPQSWDDTKFNRYLDFGRKGGALVVINSDGNSIGKFGKFLSIQAMSNDTMNFTGVVSNGSRTVTTNVSSTANGIAIKPSNDTNIIAYYTNNGSKEIKPFAIEKNLDNNGRIIYIIADGYFDAIYDNPKKYFSTLANFSDFLYLNSKNPITPQSTSKPIKRFIGEGELSGKVSINTSSFSVIKDSANSNNLVVKQIQFFDKNGNLKNHYENLSLVNLKLYGRYEVSIDSSGPLTFPATLSQSEYAHISLPNEFDLTLHLHDNENSGAEIIVTNNSSIDTFKLANESKIVFKKIRSDIPSEFVELIIKHPVVNVNGNLKFEKTNFYGESNYPPLDVVGNATAKFDFIDHIEDSYHNGIRIQYLGYLDSITTDGRMKQVKQELKLPGDISPDVKKRGLDVPLLNILGSSSNISLIAVITIGTTLITLYIRRVQNEQHPSKS
jgi:hypothetical protein